MVSYYGAWIKIFGNLSPIWPNDLLERAIEVAGVNAAINLTQPPRSSQAGNSLSVGFVFSRAKKQEGQPVNRSAYRIKITLFLVISIRLFQSLGIACQFMVSRAVGQLRRFHLTAAQSLKMKMKDARKISA